jgi:hypothetical protein
MKPMASMAGSGATLLAFSAFYADECWLCQTIFLGIAEWQRLKPENPLMAQSLTVQKCVSEASP